MPKTRTPDVMLIISEDMLLFDDVPNLSML